MKDEFEQSLQTFINALRLLLKEPSEICDAFNNYNVAWEFKDELDTGRYLLNISHGYLSEKQEELTREFIIALDEVPESILHEAKTSGANLIAMNHPCWAELRKHANILLNSLAKNASGADSG